MIYPDDEDPIELFSDEEVKKLKDSLNQPWLDFSLWKPREFRCDCGAKVAKTTCAFWCSTRKA